VLRLKQEATVFYGSGSSHVFSDLEKKRMSTFKVQLVRSPQSDLDTALVSGVSKQRSIYVAGPNRIPRLLNDGETFTDCNYWKRFAEPQMSADQAFIQVVSDDGSVFTDDGTGNVYPRVYDLTVGLGTTYTDPGNEIDLLADTGSFAVFTQISVTGDAVKVRINGNTSATFDIAAGATQIFNPGEFTITSLQFDNSAGSGAATVQVLFSIKTVCNS
jgi:hypothetical protein